MLRHAAFEFAKTQAPAADVQRQITSLNNKMTLSSNLSRLQGITQNPVPANAGTGMLSTRIKSVTFQDTFDLRYAQEITQAVWQNANVL